MLRAGEGIKANTTLEELFLNGNAIGDDGARHLMAALKGNKSLECLSLQVGLELAQRSGVPQPAGGAGTCLEICLPMFSWWG